MFHILTQINEHASAQRLLCGLTCNLVLAHAREASLTLPPACVPHHKLSAAVINKANPKGLDIN